MCFNFLGRTQKLYHFRKEEKEKKLNPELIPIYSLRYESFLRCTKSLHVPKLKIRVFQANIAFCWFEDKNYPPNCSVGVLKVHQVNRCFVARTRRHLLDSSEWKSFSLTVGLRYQNFFLKDKRYITNASWQKTVDHSFSPQCVRYSLPINIDPWQT